MPRSKVAVLRVSPDRILDDVDRLCELADVRAALKPGAQTILKDNISWHFPFPGANTTPWQLEGTIRSLRGRGYDDLVCVQNKTVVTDAFKGEDLNGYVPDLPALHDAGSLQLQARGHDVVGLPARSEDERRSTRSSPKASTSPTASSAKTSSICRR